MTQECYRAGLTIDGHDYLRGIASQTRIWLSNRDIEHTWYPLGRICSTVSYVPRFETVGMGARRVDLSNKVLYICGEISNIFAK